MDIISHDKLICKICQRIWILLKYISNINKFKKKFCLAIVVLLKKGCTKYKLIYFTNVVQLATKVLVKGFYNTF